MFGRSVLWIGLAAMTLAGANGWGATYYVDSSGGSDSNSGTSPSAAWRTVSRVNQGRYNPGDSVLFKRGGHWREGMLVYSSGTSSAPITFGSYGDGPLPVISGAEEITGMIAADGSQTETLGPELVAGGDFSSGAGLSLTNCSVVNGRLEMNGNLGTAVAEFPLGGDEAGREYEIKYEIAAASKTGYILYLSKFGNFGETFALDSSPGAHTYRMVCVDPALPFRLVCNQYETVTLDNLSVRAVQPGGGSGSSSGVYKKTYNTAPFTVVYNGEALKKNTSGSSNIGSNEWAWISGTLYVNVGENPANGLLEAPVRNTCVYTNSRSHLVFENLRFENAVRCLYLDQSPNITVRHCYIGISKYQGVYNYLGHGFVAEGNTAITGTKDAHYSSGGLISEGDSLFFNNRVAFCDIGIQLGRSGGYTGEIYNNHVHDIGRTYGDIGAVDGQGIELTGYGDERVYNVKIYNNLVYDCTGGGIAIWKASNNEICYNVVYRCGKVKGDYILENSGIMSHEGGLSSWEDSDNNLWFNNTVDICPVGVQVSGTCNNNQFFNNIITNAEYYGFQLGSAAKPVNDYNILYNNKWNFINGSLGSNSRVANPLYVNAAANDYCLQPGSPCIGAGTVVHPDAGDGLHPASTWPNGVLRIGQEDHSAEWDIGAYVFHVLPLPPVGLTIEMM